MKSFAKECEEFVVSNGGVIVRDGLSHGVLDGFIYPARTKEAKFMEDDFFTPRGLVYLFPALKRGLK